jgi:hypothetical protein
MAPFRALSQHQEDADRFIGVLTGAVRTGQEE